MKKYLFENKILTVPVIVLVILGLVSAAVWRLSVAYVEISDFFTGTLSFALRFVLTRATYFIPFSLAEIMLFACAPLFIFILVRLITAKKKRTALLKLLTRAAAVWGAFMFVFTFTLGVCYGKSPVNTKMGFERRLISSDDLYAAMEILTGELNEIAASIDYTRSESTKMPYGFRELSNKLNGAYKNMLGKYKLFNRINARAKPAVISELMSRMHITGVYSFFTGEANVNVGFPDYSVVYAAAHEMAHLMGVGREDEANFVAFLVCIHSGDDYIRYSGLANMSEYIGGALYRANSDKYIEAMAAMPEVVINERAAYSKFFDKYRDTQISQVASAVNNTYLKAQGQEEGVKSYGLVVDFAVAYLLEVYKNEK